MKKLFFLLVSLVMVTSIFASCDDKDKFISYENLPVGAKQFIASNFGPDNVISVEYDKDMKGAEYEVKFSNGAEINFDKNGNWDEITVPGGINQNLIPEKVYSYVQSHHANALIVSMDKERRTFDVELNNGLELIFDTNYNFIRYDN
ncbi:MAG: PepSY-like domain-containing protein [Bacteroidales bacterium]